MMIVMIILLIITSVWLEQYSVYSQACVNPVPIPCATTNSSIITIAINGVYPQGNCLAFKNDSFIIVYDPILINTVWITLQNTDNACPASVAVKQTAVAAKMNIASPKQVLILAITVQYIRIIVTNVSCVTCTATTMASDTETGLLSSGISLYPIYNDLNQLGQYCLNGGTINPSYTGAGYNCICPTSTAVFTGPNCEYMERTINTRQTYMNVFRSATTIDMRFSIFSTGTPGGISLLTIKSNSYQKVFEISISEATLVFKAENSEKTIIQAIDDQKWYDFIVVMTTQNVTFSVNSQTNSSVFTTIGSSNFNSFYLLLNEQSSNTFSICMKNLIINSRIIDLNSASYNSCCLNRCSNCSANQNCDCFPFKSISSTKCYCKPGYQLTGTSCTLGNNSPSQLKSDIVSTLQVNPVSTISRLDFGFQTLSSNGNIITVNLQTPALSVAVQIANTNLTLNIPNIPLMTLNYNVSNGYQHNVSLLFNLYSVTMILDNSYNYSTVALTNWFSPTTTVNEIKITSLSFGKMISPPPSPYNSYTTCFSSLQLNVMSDPTIPLNLTQGSNLDQRCDTGLRCVNVTCAYGTTCNDSLWQNTQCVSICTAKYTYMNDSCIYNGCIINPCKNGGACYYNANYNNYSCNCTKGFSGYNCDIILVELWYIAIIVVLFLLLVILIVLLVYCCCCASRRPVNDTAIMKINENIVVYNDQAGESDYNGPPINFAIMKNALQNGPQPVLKVASLPPPDFMEKKDEFDKNNNDLVLDYPLEYGFEGFESENESISSIGSKSNSGDVEFSDLGVLKNYLPDEYDT